MREERLLERLNRMERDPQSRERPDHGRLLDSILAHLRCLLNTRQGSAQIAPDYGVPDFLDLLQRYPDSVREIESGIRRAIELYEPRLEGVQVSFLPRDEESLSLTFDIRASLREEGRGKTGFQTVVETDGRIKVKR